MLKIFKQVGSGSCIMENAIEITVFNCLTIFHWILPKNDDEFGLAIPILRENTLFCMSNTLLEVFLELETSWQW